MMEFGLKGITSFSTKPLTIAIYLGFLSAFLSLFYLPYVFYSIYFGHAISGWASLIVTVAFLGGLQLMILGILGLYLGKLFMQSKRRPHYIIKESNVMWLEWKKVLRKALKRSFEEPAMQNSWITIGKIFERKPK